MSTDFIPPSAVAAVRAVLRSAGFISLDRRHELARYAGCTLPEIDAAIDFVCKSRAARFADRPALRR